jgi:hypothetical protein
MLMSTGTERNGRPGHANRYEEPKEEAKSSEDGVQMEITDYPEYMPGGGGDGKGND